MSESCGKSLVATRAASRKSGSAGLWAGKRKSYHVDRTVIIESYQCSNSGESEIPMPATHLLKRPARIGRHCRHPYLHQKLVGLQEGGQGSGDKLIRTDRSLPIFSTQHKRSAERYHRHRQLRRRIRMTEAPAHCAAVTNLNVANETRGFTQQRPA